MLAVVSDSSPLIYLTRLGQLPLLRALHDAVIVPQAVWDEVAVRGAGLPESSALRSAVADGWIQVKIPDPTAETLGSAAGNLGRADIEAILLARQLGAVLLTDDAKARELAESLAVKVTGTVGILIRAKQLGHFPLLKPLLEQLMRETNFRMSKALCEETLRIAGE